MSQQSADPVAVSDGVEGVKVVSIQRPARRNALNFEVKDRIADLVSSLDADPTVRAIVITGSDGYFVAGTDVAEMVSLTPTEHTLRSTDRMFRTLWACETPLLAAVEGYALGGGCELALSCDLIVASRTATFGLPEVRLGVMPGAGGTQRLLRIVGKYRALRLLLTGDSVNGEQAYQLGMVSELVESGTALESALDLAATISKRPRLAVQAILDVVDAGMNVSLDAGLTLERKAFQLLFDTADQQEGMSAFLDKRTPDYRGL